jgi:hypothetical protein
MHRPKRSGLVSRGCVLSKLAGTSRSLILALASSSPRQNRVRSITTGQTISSRDESPSALHKSRTAGSSGSMLPGRK